MIQQGRPFSFVSKFVHNNHTLEQSQAIRKLPLFPAHWAVDTLKGSCTRSGRQWRNLGVSLLPEVNVKKRGYKEHKDDLAEYSGLHPAPTNACPIW